METPNDGVRGGGEAMRHYGWSWLPPRCLRCLHWAFAVPQRQPEAGYLRADFHPWLDNAAGKVPPFGCGYWAWWRTPFGTGVAVSCAALLVVGLLLAELRRGLPVDNVRADLINHTTTNHSNHRTDDTDHTEHTEHTDHTDHTEHTDHTDHTSHTRCKHQTSHINHNQPLTLTLGTRRLHQRDVSPAV